MHSTRVLLTPPFLYVQCKKESSVEKRRERRDEGDGEAAGARAKGVEASKNGEDGVARKDAQKPHVTD